MLGIWVDSFAAPKCGLEKKYYKTAESGYVVFIEAPSSSVGAAGCVLRSVAGNEWVDTRLKQAAANPGNDHVKLPFSSGSFRGQVEVSMTTKSVTMTIEQLK